MLAIESSDSVCYKEFLLSQHNAESLCAIGEVDLAP